MMKNLVGPLLLGVALSGGCVTVWGGSPPACPPISEEVFEEMVGIIMEEEYLGVTVWLSEMERYCSSIDAMRDA